MVRRRKDQKVEYKSIRGGVGELMVRPIVNGDELYGKGKMFAKITIAPGQTIGEHTHDGDNEIVHILSGEAVYNDNGTIVTLYPGDTAVCSSGERHFLKNESSADLVVIALILNN